MFRNRAVSLALVGLLSSTTACTSYKRIEVAEVAEHRKVRVTSISAGNTELQEPNVSADSLVGRVGEFHYSIPLAGVSSVEAKGVSAAKTVGLVMRVAVVVVPIAGYAGHCSSDPGGLGSICP